MSIWKDVNTAPKDGTFIDMKRGDERFVDCHFSKRHNAFVMRHGYPAITTVFKPQPTHWTDRPDGLCDPYTGEYTGKCDDA